MPDRLIRLGHSPDPDDAFMFYALADELIPTDGFRFEHVLRDIETLNDWARRAARGHGGVGARLRLPRGHLPAAPARRLHGRAVRPDGRRARGPIDPAELPRLRVAIPGLLTSAFLELQLAVGRIADPVIVPFDRILDVVEAGEVDAGLVIHEGQLTYETQGLRSILDLGEWWHELTGGLPLPLGANAVRRDLDEGDTLPRLSRLLRESIAYGLEHRPGALAPRRAVRARPRPGPGRSASWACTSTTAPSTTARTAAPRWPSCCAAARGGPDRPRPVVDFVEDSRPTYEKKQFAFNIALRASPAHP